MNDTIAFYNDNAERLKADKSFRDMEQTIDDFLTHVPTGGKILDLGCGFGWDSKIFVDKGYDVTLLDGSSKMCELAHQYTGAPYICREFQTFDEVDKYDGIWANVSLIHVPLNQQISVWKNLYNALKSSGVVYASYFYGNGFRIKDKCYYCDITADNVSEIIKQSGTWDNIEVWMTKELHYRKLETFTNIFALKLL